jgi:hypothetical protein
MAKWVSTAVSIGVGTVVSILVFFQKPSLTLLVLLFSVAYLCFAFGVWFCPWVKDQLWRRLVSLLAVAVCVCIVGYSIRPIEQLSANALKKSTAPLKSEQTQEAKPSENNEKPVAKTGRPKSAAVVSPSPQQQIVNAPHGIGSIGGTLINPQVNNYAPPIRTLSDAQKRGIEEFLRTIPSSVQVSIGSVYGSGDADNYAGEFFPLFVERHLENQSLPSIRTGFSAIFTGVFVCTPTDDDPASPYRNALVDKLNSLGITAQRANGSKVPSGNLELLIGFRPEEVRPR